MNKHNYFVRVKLEHAGTLYNFCTRNNLNQGWISTGFGGFHNGTELYRIRMAPKDATAMKITVPVEIMETQHD